MADDTDLVALATALGKTRAAEYLAARRCACPHSARRQKLAADRACRDLSLGKLTELTERDLVRRRCQDGSRRVRRAMPQEQVQALSAAEEVLHDAIRVEMEWERPQKARPEHKGAPTEVLEMRARRAPSPE